MTSLAEYVMFGTRPSLDSQAERGLAEMIRMTITGMADADPWDRPSLAAIRRALSDAQKEAADAYDAGVKRYEAPA